MPPPEVESKQHSENSRGCVINFDSVLKRAPDLLTMPAIEQGVQIQSESDQESFDAAVRILVSGLKNDKTNKTGT